MAFYYTPIPFYENFREDNYKDNFIVVFSSWIRENNYKDYLKRFKFNVLKYNEQKECLEYDKTNYIVEHLRIEYNFTIHELKSLNDLLKWFDCVYDLFNIDQLSRLKKKQLTKIQKTKIKKLKTDLMPNIKSFMKHEDLYFWIDYLYYDFHKIKNFLIDKMKEYQSINQENNLKGTNQDISQNYNARIFKTEKAYKLFKEWVSNINQSTATAEASFIIRAMVKDDLIYEDVKHSEFFQMFSEYGINIDKLKTLDNCRTKEREQLYSTYKNNFI